MPFVGSQELPEPPHDIDRYRECRVIGSGPTSIVYEAQQHEPVRRTIALKILRRDTDSKEAVARFQRERQALAMMDHPHIAQIYDAGIHQGRPFFVMELVQGAMPITDYCDDRRLTIQDRLTLFMAVCEAIHHAHQKGVIHRDLKPTNVLVTETGGKHIPKVIDFGIAKAIGAPLTEDAEETKQGLVIGTLWYMSPEQLSGPNVDTRTDIYSLGVILYELMVGVHPLAGVERPRDVYKVRRLIETTDPSPPSKRFRGLRKEQGRIAEKRRVTPESLRRQVKGDMDAIVNKAMAKARDRRYESAQDLASDVQRHLDHQPVLAQVPNAVYVARKFVRRHKAGVTVAVSLVVAIMVGLALATVGMVRARQAEAVAAREAETAREVSAFLIGMFRQSDPIEARGEAITAREILDRGAERLNAELLEQPLTRARLLSVIGTVYMDLGLYEPASQMFQTALAVRREIYPDGHPDLAEGLNFLGGLAFRRGNYIEAEKHWLEALDIRERTLDDLHPDRAQSLTNLGALNAVRGKHDAARSLFSRALTIWDSILPADDPRLASTRNNLANLYWAEGQLDDAESLYRRALAVQDSVLGPDHPDVAMTLNNLASVNSDQGKYANAEPLLQRALAIREQNLEADHPDVATSLHNLALLYLRQGWYRDAEPLFERSLIIREAALGPEHHYVAQNLNNIGRLYLREARFDEAEAVLLRALAIRESVLGTEHPEVAASLVNLGELALIRDDQPAAESSFVRALAIQAPAVRRANPAMAEAFSGLARLYARQAKHREADSLFRRVLSIREETFGPEHPLVGETLMQLAELLRQMQRVDEAARLEDRAAAIEADVNARRRGVEGRI